MGHRSRDFASIDTGYYGIQSYGIEQGGNVAQQAKDGFLKLQG